MVTLATRLVCRWNLVRDINVDLAYTVSYWAFLLNRRREIHCVRAIFYVGFCLSPLNLVLWQIQDLAHFDCRFDGAVIALLALDDLPKLFI